MFTKSFSITRVATAFALVFALSVGAASAANFQGEKAATAMSVTELNKYQSDHGGYGPEYDMPFMPGSD